MVKHHKDLNFEKKELAYESGMSRRVMQRIEVENIRMRPSIVFIARTVFLSLIVAVTAGIGVFFTSVIFYKLLAVRVFGVRFLLLHIPWFSVGLAISCFLLCFAVIEYYKLAYKLTLFRLFMLLAVVFVGFAFLLYKTPLHENLRRTALSSIYSVDGQPLVLYAGRVVESRTANIFYIETLRGERVKIYLIRGARIPSKGIHEGQSVFVAGYTENGKVVARSVMALKDMSPAK